MMDLAEVMGKKTDGEYPAVAHINDNWQGTTSSIQVQTLVFKHSIDQF